MHTSTTNDVKTTFPALPITVRYTKCFPLTSIACEAALASWHTHLRNFAWRHVAHVSIFFRFPRLRVKI